MPTSEFRRFKIEEENFHLADAEMTENKAFIWCNVAGRWMMNREVRRRGREVQAEPLKVGPYR